MCRRGDRCAGRVQVRDPDTGELLGWAPDRPTAGRPDGLCTTCTGRVDAALVALPTLLHDLDRLVGRDATAAPLSPTPTGGTRDLPIPLRTHIDAVRVWAGHLLESWAARVGAHLDTHTTALDPDPDTGHHGPRRHLPWADQPHTARTGPAALCGWLRAHRAALLDLPAAPMPVWSMGEHPADHRDIDTVTVGPGRDGHGQLWWAEQDGTTAGVDLIDAHTAAQSAAGTTQPRQTSSVGCTRCGWPTTHRHPGDPVWTCPRCRHERSEDDHDVLLAHLVTSRPETPPVARARTAKDHADTRARTARLAARRPRH